MCDSTNLYCDHKQQLLFLWFSQNASPVVPYLSMACVFAFILSFGLGPGIRLKWSLLTVFSTAAFTQTPTLLLLLLLFLQRWRHQHPDHGAVHPGVATCSLHDRRVGQLAELFLHQYGLPFHRGKWWLDEYDCKLSLSIFLLIHIKQKQNKSVKLWNIFPMFSKWVFVEQWTFRTNVSAISCLHGCIHINLRYSLKNCYSDMLVFCFCLLLTQLGLQQYCFLVFLAICIGVTTYIYLVIPETKNKTFLEIQDDFGSPKKRNAHSADGVRKTLLSTSVWTKSIQEHSMLRLPVFSTQMCVFVMAAYLLSTRGRLYYMSPWSDWSWWVKSLVPCLTL